MTMGSEALPSHSLSGQLGTDWEVMWPQMIRAQPLGQQKNTILTPSSPFNTMELFLLYHIEQPPPHLFLDLAQTYLLVTSHPAFPGLNNEPGLAHLSNSPTIILPLLHPWSWITWLVWISRTSKVFARINPAIGKSSLYAPTFKGCPLPISATTESQHHLVPNLGNWRSIMPAKSLCTCRSWWRPLPSFVTQSNSLSAIPHRRAEWFSPPL